MLFLSIGSWQILLICWLIISAGLPLIALIDILRSKFIGNKKIAWLFIIFFVPIIGAPLYFMTGRKQKK